MSVLGVGDARFGELELKCKSNSYTSVDGAVSPEKLNMEAKFSAVIHSILWRRERGDSGVGESITLIYFLL